MAGRKKPIAEDNPLFRWVLIINVMVFLVMVGIMIYVVWMEGEKATDLQKSLFEVGRNGAMLMIGTFSGLVGAKAGRPEYLAEVAQPTRGASRAKKDTE
jgi:hypothetical protein